MTLKHALAQSLKKVLTTLRGKRDPRIKLLQKMPSNAICAEIGVWKGDFSEQILRLTKPQLLHLVDPWEFQSEFSNRMYGGSVAKNQNDMNLIYSSVQTRFMHLNNVEFNRGKSEAILESFPNEYFDWVYIDGNHYYEYVLKDLELCYLKTKPSGIISGDDYTWGKSEGFPVKKAVEDFLDKHDAQNNLEIIGSQFLIYKKDSSQ